MNFRIERLEMNFRIERLDCVATTQFACDVRLDCVVPNHFTIRDVDRGDVNLPNFGALLSSPLANRSL